MQKAKLMFWQVEKISDTERRLSGLVFGHPNFRDGEVVTTSPVEKIEGHAATTRNTVYELGDLGTHNRLLFEVRALRDEIEQASQPNAFQDAEHEAALFAEYMATQFHNDPPPKRCLDCLPEICWDDVVVSKHWLTWKAARTITPATPQANDPIRTLIGHHGAQLYSNPYAYFELAYTRYTGWMAWICSNSREQDPDRKVLAQGQGETPEEACENAAQNLIGH